MHKELRKTLSCNAQSDRLFSSLMWGSFTSLTVPQKKVASKNLYFILTTAAVAMSPTIKNNHYTTFKACLCFAISPFLCAAWYPSTVASTHCQKIQYHRVWLLRQELPRQEQWLYAPSAVHRPNLQNAKEKEIWMSMVFLICNNKSILSGSGYSDGSQLSCSLGENMHVLAGVLIPARCSMCKCKVIQDYTHTIFF